MSESDAESLTTPWNGDRVLFNKKKKMMPGEKKPFHCSDEDDDDKVMMVMVVVAAATATATTYQTPPQSPMFAVAHGTSTLISAPREGSAYDHLCYVAESAEAPRD